MNNIKNNNFDSLLNLSDTKYNKGLEIRAVITITEEGDKKSFMAFAVPVQASENQGEDLVAAHAATTDWYCPEVTEPAAGKQEV